MPRGGKRSTSFAPTWNLGKTELVRIPVAIIQKIRYIANVEDNGQNYERKVILEAIDKFIESQRGHAGGNQHKPAGELKLGSVHWRKLNEFKKWIEDE